MTNFVILGQVASLAHVIILVIIAAGIIGIGLICLRQFGISVPPFIVSIFWVVLAVVIGVLAIRAIMAYL